MGNTSSNCNTTASGFVELHPSAEERKQGQKSLRLELISANCIRQHWFNNLSISFFPFEMTSEDLQAVGRGKKLDCVSERPSPDCTKWSWSPSVHVGVTLGPAGDGTTDLVYSMKPVDATVTAVWFREKGHHVSRTVRLPTEGFVLKQLPKNEIQLVWAGNFEEMSFNLVANSIISAEPEHGSVEWQTDTTGRCWRCADEFTFFNRRHHCRTCGLVVCGTCSDKTDEKGERICNVCHKENNVTS